MFFVDDKSENLYCLHVPNGSRNDFIDLLRKGAARSSSFVVPCSNYDVKIVPGSSSSRIIVSGKEITMNLTEADIGEIVAAVEEHLSENGDLPLDHSLESVGVEFEPTEIEDFIIETVD